MSAITNQREIDTNKVRRLNDIFRSSMDCKRGTVMLTSSVQDLQMSNADLFVELIDKIRKFSAFDKAINYDLPLDEQEESNNPYGENDFGKVTLSNGKTFFFKIDYYDKEMQFGSKFPDDPLLTSRVMTIMYTKEY